MSSRCLSTPAGSLTLILIAALALCGCEREERDYRQSRPLPRKARRSPSASSRRAEASCLWAFSNAYEESAYAVAEGKRLYRWYNCNGCHANGGGGSGPPLMDAEWIYGSAPANVLATILKGRPNGMPAFGGKIPDHQAMQIAAYVRSMGGMLPKDVAPGRADHLRAKEPESATDQLAPKGFASPPSAGASR
jgi:cytochrome c oxidase cbb3-type subunit 3